MKKRIVWLPSIAWMGLIYAMSAMPGDVSGAQSGAVLAFILSFAGKLFPQLAAADADLLHLLLRKGAHMAAYAVLALLNVRACRQSGAKRPCLQAFFLAFAYAAADEFHQGFVAGRGPSCADVMIDSAGALSALAAVHIKSYIKIMNNKRNANNGR